MRSLSFRLLLSFLLLVAAVPLLAHSVTISTPTTFAALDGSSADHDGVTNGVFTVSDGDLIVNAAINCNDVGPGSSSACAMAFNVSGNLSINADGALYAENRMGSGNGGAITLTVGGDLVLNGNGIVSSAAISHGLSNGGSVQATVGGAVNLSAGSTIDAGAANGNAGNISVAAGGVVVIDGNVLSGPSRSLLGTRLTAAVLSGGNGNQSGGDITISSSTFAEPAMTVGPAANIVSQSRQDAGSVTLEGCGIDVRGLVASVTGTDSGAVVVIRSGKDLSIDGRDLGATGTRMGRVRADSLGTTAADNRAGLFASETIAMSGPYGGLFLITANPVSGNNVEGGQVRVVSTGDALSASGNAIDSGRSSSGSGGGTITLAASADVSLDTAVLRAVGGSGGSSSRHGGSVGVRSHSGNVLWTNGTGDVRPVGSASGLTPTSQGTIILTACGTVNTTGSSFPVNGTATGMHPETQTGICSPSTPSLPDGVPPLGTCNTPPVANDVTESTLEDESVTITLSGSDSDGDPLTFSLVSGPANGVLGPIVPTGPSSATVQYSPNANFNGSDSFVYQANDGNGGTGNATVTITVVAVNDPPSFLAGPTTVSLEDAGPQSYPNWATAISAGPADESGQTVAFTVSNDNPSLFSAQPALSATGTLTWTSAPDAYGSATLTVVAQDNGGTANGGIDTSAPQSSPITVTPVNDAPSFTAGGNITANEDSGPSAVAWATGISAGPNEGSQTVTFFATAADPSLFSVQPAVSASGVLTFTPAANANGSTTVSVYLMDDGGTANGGAATSPAQTFTISITGVNDAPSFTSGGNVTVHEDSAAYAAAWATAISAGPADESGQALTFGTSNDNNAFFSVQPAISPSGVLTFSLAANAFGSANVTVTLSDDGGTANGGVDTSAPQSFTITVNAVNDAPSFTAGGNVTLNEDDPPYSAAWASGITAGPNEGGQTVAFVVTNDSNSLFIVQPAVSPTGVLTFTLAANAYGVANVTVVLTDDGGTANGGVDTSAPVSFTINVAPVSDPPNAAADAWDTIGNTLLQVGATQTVAAPAVFAAGSVLSNDTDSDSPPGSLTATLNPGSVTAGAIVTMNADGTFTYLPPAGHPGATDSFTYTVSDGSSSAIGVVTITLKGRVWYVRNNGVAPGTGRSTEPFVQLNAASLLRRVEETVNARERAETAISVERGVRSQSASSPNDTIFIFTGDGTTQFQGTGFNLQNGQRLLGEGVALTVLVSVNGGPNPTVLLPAGTKPKMTNIGGSGVTATGVSGVTVAGLEITGATGDGMTLTNASSVTVDTVAIKSNLGSGISGSSVVGFSLTNSTIDGNGDDAAADEAGISFANLTGAATISNTTIANSVEDNVRIVNSAGVLDRVTFSNVTFGSNHNTTGNDGLLLQSTGTATLKATIQNSAFAGARGDLFQFSVRDGSVADLVFTGNSLSNNHPSIVSGGGGMTISGGSAAFNATFTYSITGNSFRDAVGPALSVGKGTVGTGSFSGTISNNLIGVAGIANSGSAQGSGIVVDILGGGSHTTSITNNQVHQYTNYGILLAAGANVSGGGQGSLVAVVQGNTIGSPSSNAATTFFPTSGVRLNSGTSSGDNANVCLTLGGAGGLANSLTGTGSNGGADVRLFQRFLTTVGLPGYAGANNDNTAVANFVQGNNGGTPNVLVSNTVSTGGGGYTGVCP